MSTDYNNLKSLIENNKELKIDKIELMHDNLILFSSTDNLIYNINILKRDNNFKFRQLIDILGIDYPQKEKRFEVVYLFLSHEKNFRISLKKKPLD